MRLFFCVSNTEEWRRERVLFFSTNKEKRREKTLLHTHFYHFIVCLHKKGFIHFLNVSSRFCCAPIMLTWCRCVLHREKKVHRIFYIFLFCSHVSRPKREGKRARVKDWRQKLTEAESKSRIVIISSSSGTLNRVARTDERKINVERFHARSSHQRRERAEVCAHAPTVPRIQSQLITAIYCWISSLLPASTLGNRRSSEKISIFYNNSSSSICMSDYVRDFLSLSRENVKKKLETMKKIEKKRKKEKVFRVTHNAAPWRRSSSAKR